METVKFMTPPRSTESISGSKLSTCKNVRTHRNKPEGSSRLLHPLSEAVQCVGLGRSRLSGEAIGHTVRGPNWGSTYADLFFQS